MGPAVVILLFENRFRRYSTRWRKGRGQAPSARTARIVWTSPVVKKMPCSGDQARTMAISTKIQIIMVRPAAACRPHVRRNLLC